MTVAVEHARAVDVVSVVVAGLEYESVLADDSLDSRLSRERDSLRVL
jgi:hypothetical protein